jgi:hypothetical protein
MDPTSKFWVEIIAAATIPLAFLGVIWHRISREMGMGYRALQFLAIGVVMPVVLILALEEKLAGEAVAAIVGGVVAYLFTATTKGKD